MFVTIGLVENHYQWPSEIAMPLTKSLWHSLSELAQYDILLTGDCSKGVGLQFSAAGKKRKEKKHTHKTKKRHGLAPSGTEWLQGRGAF